MAIENAPFKTIRIVAFIFAAPVMVITYVNMFKRYGVFDNWFLSHLAATVTSGFAVVNCFPLNFAGLVAETDFFGRRINAAHVPAF